MVFLIHYLGVILIVVIIDVVTVTIILYVLQILVLYLCQLFSFWFFYNSYYVFLVLNLLFIFFNPVFMLIMTELWSDNMSVLGQVVALNCILKTFTDQYVDQLTAC